MKIFITPLTSAKRLSALAVFCLLFIATVTEADVYKHVDKEGRLIKFSDQPQYAGDKPVSLSKPALEFESSKKSSKKAPPETAVNKPKRVQKQKQETITPVIAYTAVTILKPNDEEAIRANSGSFPIELASQPALDSSSGHRYIVMVDGEKHAESTSATFTVENMSRGAHSISVEVRDRADSVLVSSSSRTIYILRAVANK